MLLASSFRVTCPFPSPPKLSQMKFKKVTIDGKHYPSVTDAAAAFGVNQSTVNLRRRAGWSIEEAFGAKPRRSEKNFKKVTIDGKDYPSMGDAAAAFGLKGASKNDAFST